MRLDDEDPKPDIVQDDNPILKTVSDQVVDFNEDLLDLISSMYCAMYEHNGVGISAIQIGVPKRVIIASFEHETLVMVNPVFIRKLNREVVEIEGCLSIPKEKWRKVSRPAKCQVRWQDAQGVFHEANFSGMLARIIQHEMDHLDGILITDKPHIP